MNWVFAPDADVNNNPDNPFINIRSFGGELLCFCYNFDPNPSALVGDPAAPRKSSVLGNSVEPVDPKLKGQYIDGMRRRYDQFASLRRQLEC